MKNFLSLDNLIFQEKNPISNFIQSSSEVSDCSITNVLEDNSSSIWISSEELPQEIILNMSRSFFKEYPKKIICDWNILLACVSNKSKISRNINIKK